MITVAGLSGRSVHVTEHQLGELLSRLDGPLLRPGQPGWDDAVTIWNGMVARTPALVVRPTSAADVAAAAVFAREHGLLLSVKGGGHNIAGTSLAPGGMTLDMSQMRDVTVDPAGRVAHVGAGCRLKDVDAATQKYGLATVLGFVSEVGVAGLALGGGLGYLTRRFGWTVDNLEEVEIVTADGEIRTASRTEHQDLFWALRGAGANFGVVTRFTLRLHEVGPDVYGGLIAWPFARAREVHSVYRTLTAAAARELSVWLVLRRAPAAPVVPEAWHGELICAMAVCYTGDPAAVDDALAPIRALADPVVDLLDTLPYATLQSFFDGDEPNGAHYYWKTEYLARLDDDLLTIVREIAEQCPMPDAEVGLLHLGGALNDHDSDDGAVGNRDAQYVFGANGMWQPDDPDGGSHRQWVRDAWTRVRPFSTGGNYINFQTADEDGDRIRDSYGNNVDRLIEIKTKYDPHNLFRVNRNIAPRAAR
jgi:FAD/FMN-containing dehydrogenase